MPVLTQANPLRLNRQTQHSIHKSVPSPTTRNPQAFSNKHANFQNKVLDIRYHDGILIVRRGPDAAGANSDLVLSTKWPRRETLARSLSAVCPAWHVDRNQTLEA